MNDIEEIYKFLKTINFDGFEYIKGNYITDSKKFLEAYYNIIKYGSEKAAKQHYYILNRIYLNFLSLHTIKT